MDRLKQLKTIQNEAAQLFDKKNQDYQEDDCDKSYNSEVKVE